MTPVEEYVASKGWEHKDANDNLNLETCPFCLKDHWSFFINNDPDAVDTNGDPKMWLYDCKRASCDVKGNEWSLKKHMGDPLPVRHKDFDGQKGIVSTKKEKYVERLDERSVNAAHDALMADEDFKDFLYFNFGWDANLLERFKIGLANKRIELEEKYPAGHEKAGKFIRADVPCVWYPYYEDGQLTFIKYRSAPSSTNPKELIFDLGVDGYNGILPRGFGAPSGHDAPLFNDDVLTTDPDYIIVIEGEKDVISCIAHGEENVVGVPGAGTKKVAWINKLMKVKKRYLLFDNDEGGEVSATKFFEKYGEANFIHVRLPAFEYENEWGEIARGKDLTEWFKSGATKEDLHALLKRTEKANGVQGVKSTADLTDVWIEEMLGAGDSRPYDSEWSDFNDVLGNVGPGQITHLQAPQKIGKTTFVINWLEWLTEKHKINTLLKCLEMPSRDLITKWGSAKMMVTEDVLRKDRAAKMKEAIALANKRSNDHDAEVMFFGNETDNEDSVESEIAKLEAIIIRHSVKVWAYDNLQFIADVLYKGERQGSHNQLINRMSKELKKLAARTNTHGIILIQSNDPGEDKLATVNNSSGSRGIKADCDYSIVLNRTTSSLAKSAGEIEKIGFVKSTNILNEWLYVTVGLSRFGQPGMCTLKIDGARSKILSLTEEDKAKLNASAAPSRRELGDGVDVSEKGLIVSAARQRIKEQEAQKNRWAEGGVSIAKVQDHGEETAASVPNDERGEGDGGQYDTVPEHSGDVQSPEVAA